MHVSIRSNLFQMHVNLIAEMEKIIIVIRDGLEPEL